MIDAATFLAATSGHADSQGGKRPRRNRTAKIDPAYASGAPKVTFDGESTLSVKTYARLGSYTPAANDRVLMVPVGTTYVIVGKIV